MLNTIPFIRRGTNHGPTEGRQGWIYDGISRKRPDANPFKLGRAQDALPGERKEMTGGTG